MPQLKKLTNRGDTIIEALMCVAILGLVIGGGYAIANKSLKVARAAQERGEALKVAEAQAELLHNLSPTNATAVKAMTNIFCLKSDGSPQGFVPPIVNLTDPAASNLANYNGTPCQIIATGGYSYNTAMKYQRLPSPGGITQDVFTIMVRWDSAQGTGQDQVRIIYKAHL